MMDKNKIVRWLAEYVGNSDILDGVDPYLYLYSAWNVPALVEDLQKNHPDDESMDDLPADEIIEAMIKHATDPVIVNSNGSKFDLSCWDDIVNAMNKDNEVPVENLQESLWPCPAQEFFDAYAEAYREVHGEDWALDVMDTGR